MNSEPAQLSLILFLIQPKMGLNNWSARNYLGSPICQFVPGYISSRQIIHLWNKRNTDQLKLTAKTVSTSLFSKLMFLMRIYVVE